MEERNKYTMGEWQRLADDWVEAGLPQQALPRCIDPCLLFVCGRPVISPWKLEEQLRVRLPEADWERSSLRDIIESHYGSRAAVVVEALL